MAGPSRNVVLCPWTQEELERLFGEELPDIDLIAGYVVDNPQPAATEVGSSRYAVEDFTESQPIEGEEYVHSTQMPETAPREVPPRRASVQPDVGTGSGSSRGGQVQRVQPILAVIHSQVEVTKGHQVLLGRRRN